MAGEHTGMLTPPNQCPYQVSTSYTLSIVSDIYPGQEFKGQGYYSKDKSEIKCHTITLHKCIPITNVPTKYQIPTPNGF